MFEDHHAPVSWHQLLVVEIVLYTLIPLTVFPNNREMAQTQFWEKEVGVLKQRRALIFLLESTKTFSLSNFSFGDLHALRVSQLA